MDEGSHLLLVFILHVLLASIQRLLSTVDSVSALQYPITCADCVLKMIVHVVDSC